jgi:prepilin-type N-terminal cleavage/methylation domain-containing protein
MRIRTAFTLIELLIAMSLGLVVCLTAFAAVRSAGQAVTQVNRLSSENSLMRAGISAAFVEMDFWSQYDEADPDRVLSADGNPFYKFDYYANGLDLKLEQHRSETLYRGCAASHFGAEAYGKYQLHSNLAHPLPDRRWEAHFLKTMSDHLGYYALADYAPANTIYSYYVDKETGAIAERFTDRPASFGTFYPTYFPDHGPADIHRLTEAGGFSIATTYPCSQRAFCFWDAGIGGPMPGWDQGSMFDKCVAKPALMPIKPRHWPNLTVDIRHFIASYRSWNTAAIHITSPLTGQVFKLFMSVTGTTLRGARRQRDLDVGVL